MDDPRARLLSRLAARDALFLLHVNADPDCVGSAFALHEAFGGTIGASQGVGKSARRLADRLGIVIDEWPHPEQFGTVVAVDTSSRSQLGRLGERAKNPALVDHHKYGDLREVADAYAWDPTRPSCAEVVLDLLDHADKTPTPRAALGLLAGIVADTQRFRHADARTLRDAARLLDLASARLEDVEALVAPDDDEEDDTVSRRIATLTAAQRATQERIGDMVLATSQVGSFDAAAAAALVRAGADVALVANVHASRARLSLRASTGARSAGLDLGIIANEAAREAGWSGGGHEGAAGLSGEPPETKARDAVLARLRAWLEARA